MDSDLIADVEALQEVGARRGVQIFRYACVGSAQDPMSGTVAGSPLFRACTPSGYWGKRPDGKTCNTLMEIKESTLNGVEFVAWLDEWTTAIRKDDRIVWSLGLVYPEQLIGYAEWQQTFRDYFRREGLLEPLPEYVPLANRLPWTRSIAPAN